MCDEGIQFHRFNQKAYLASESGRLGSIVISNKHHVLAVAVGDDGCCAPTGCTMILTFSNERIRYDLPRLSARPQ